MYKKSKFNIEINKLDDGKILIFNSLTYAFGIMDLETQIIYKKIESFIIGSTLKPKEKNEIETLLRQGYIVPEELDEIKILKLRSQSQRYLNKELALTIAPTLNCNMACPYCFENKKNISMHEEIKIVLLEFVDSYLKENDCKKLHVTWYGGEPLLEIETIKELSHKFIELCNNEGLDYSASIVTNGVLLTQGIANMLHDTCKVKNAQITIDGLPEYHNKRRILLDGRESFNIIVKNIEDCKDKLQISVRVNVDKNNMNNVMQLTNYFINTLGWVKKPSFYLAPVEVYNDNCYLKRDECLNENEFNFLDSLVLNQIYDAEPKGITKLILPKKNGNFCGAVQHGSYVIDPDGDLYTCWNVIGTKNKKIGNIINKRPMNLEYLNWLTYEPDGKCLECNLLPVCLGGCPYEYFNYGKHVCNKKALGIKERLKIVYKDYCIKKTSEVGLKTDSN